MTLAGLRAQGTVGELTQTARVVAVVVVYQPCLAGLQRLLNALCLQVSHVVIVDNAAQHPVSGEGGVGSQLDTWLASHRWACEIHYQPQASNIGLAAAQNVGVAYAQGLGCDAVLLCDQDSVPAADMVAALLQGYLALQANGQQVAAVGPCHTDARLAPLSPFVRAEGGRMVYCACPPQPGWVRCDHVIASGCLIALSRWDQVGGMEEGLFIDLVDIEWCYRASRFGAQCYGIAAATMQHALGDEPYRVLGRPIAQRVPVRHFYLFRNTVLLFRRTYVPRAWKWSETRKLVARFVIHTLWGRPRRTVVRMMVSGLWQGVRGQAGPYTP